MKRLNNSRAETRKRYVEIMKLRRRGLTIPEICKELGVCPSTVSGAVKWSKK